MTVGIYNGSSTTYYVSSETNDGFGLMTAPMFQTDTTVVVWMGYSLYKINVSTAMLVWDYIPSGSKTCGSIAQGPLLIYASIFEVNHGNMARSNYSIVAIRADGSLAWENTSYTAVDNLTVGLDGTLYFTYSGSSLGAISPAGTVLWTASTLIGGFWPGPFAIGKDGSMYISDADSLTGSVYRFLPSNLLVVAGGSGTNSMIYSYDGKNWLANSSGSSMFTECRAVAKGIQNGRQIWLAGGSGSNTLAYSYDGLEWTGLGTTIFSTQCNSIGYNGNIWIAGGEGTNSIAYSTNGIDWLQSTSGNSVITTSVYTVVWNGFMWVAGGSGSNTLAYSSDGINWTGSGTSIFSTSCNALAYNGLWVSGGSGTNQLAYSYDGVNWSASSSGNAILTTSCSSVAWNGTLWLAGGEGTNTLAFSYDGITWGALGDTTFSTECLSLTWSNSLWIAGGSGTNNLAYSTDGLTWTPSSTALLTTVYALPAPPLNAFSTQCLVGGGTNYSPYFNMCRSPNGITWSGDASGSATSGEGFNTFFYDGTMWVAGGGNGNGFLAYSYDGIQWTYANTANAGFNGGILSIAKSDSMWIACGNNTSIAYSYDGINWFNLYIIGNIYNFVQANFRIVWNRTMWILSGQIGFGYFDPVSQLAYSYDGFTWALNSVPQYGLFWVYRYIVGIATNTKMWIAIGYRGREGYGMAYSYDGNNWPPVTNAETIFVGTTLTSIATNGTRWLAGGVGTNRIFYSFDGVNWNISSSGNSVFSTGCNSVTWNGYLWVGVGGSNTGTATAGYSLDGINWTASSSLTPLMNSYVNVVSAKRPLPNYPNFENIIIAGGIGTNSLAYSYDGANWLASANGNSIFSSGVYAIAYNSVNWIACGEGTNVLAYSADGKTWTVSSNGNSIFSGSYAVAWNGILFVAGGYGTNTLAYSYDGIYWFASVNGNSIFSDVYAIAYNGSKWVAGGDGSNTLATSSDGINWTGLGSSIFSSVSLGLATNGSIFVATGVGINTLAYSSDGVNWTGLGESIFSSLGYGIAYNGSKWVAGGNGTNTLAYSTDGTSWTGLGSSIFSSQCTSVAWNGSKWLAGGEGTNQIAYSTDGIHWIPSASGNSIITTTVYGLATKYRAIPLLTPSLDKFAVGGSNANSWNANIMGYSPDGIRWLSSASGNSLFNYSCYSIAWNGSIWLAGGYGSLNGIIATFIYSYDGINWAKVIAKPSIFLSTNLFQAYSIAWNGSMWVAGGTSTVYPFTMGYSFDGLNWDTMPSANTLFSSGGYGYPKAIATDGSKWVAGGYDGTRTIMTYSPDGFNWLKSPTNIYNYMNTINVIATNGSKWLAGGDYYQLLYSTDGMNWADTGVRFNNQCYGIGWNGTMWIACGGDNWDDIGNIKYSTDGTTWTNANSITGIRIVYRYSSVSWDGSKWIIGGYGGNIYSTDGMNWYPSYSSVQVFTNLCSSVVARRSLF
jgi:hypothetical protein